MLSKTRRILARGSATGADVEDPLDPLLARLASPQPDVVERAKLEIVAAGANSVPMLLHCLECDGTPLRVRALSLLALVGDARAAAPVASLLRHPESLVRIRAAGALARIASPNATTSLARLLRHEAEPSVRLAATRSLVRLVQSGHDSSLRPLLELIADPEEGAAVRAAALEAIPWVIGPGNEAALKGLVEQVAGDPSRDVARKAKRLLRAATLPRLAPWALDKLIEDLRSERLEVWRRAVARLGRAGGSVVEPLIAAILENPTDREIAQRSALVLRSLSARQLHRLGAVLDSCTSAVPLLALLEVVAGNGGRALLTHVAALVQRLASANDPALAPVRQKAHHVLAVHGSRVAAEDLRAILEDRRTPILPELADAVARIGTAHELPALLRAYRRSRGIARLALRDAVLALCRREKIRRTDKVLAGVEGAERVALQEILGEPPRKAVRTRLARIDRVESPLLP